jgi:hypothetical protein
MALVVLLVFSVLGFVTAVVGFLGFGVSVSAAFVIYFAVALGAPGCMLPLIILSRLGRGRGGPGGTNAGTPIPA